MKYFKIIQHLYLGESMEQDYKVKVKHAHSFFLLDIVLRKWSHISTLSPTLEIGFFLKKCYILTISISETRNDLRPNKCPFHMSHLSPILAVSENRNLAISSLKSLSTYCDSGNGFIHTSSYRFIASSS